MTSKWFDNTDPRQAEADANLLTDVLEASTEYSVIGLDLEGRILMWNEGARRLYGYEPEEVVGKANSAILYTLEDVAQDVPRQVLDSALRDGKWEDSISRRSKNGQYFTARVVITPRRNADGTPTGYLLISKEISDEIRLTDELKATQFYTRSLIESNIDAMMTTDPLGIITDVNQQMEALTEYSREQLIGTPFKNYFTDPLRAEEGIGQVLRDHTVTNYELTARSKLGRETFVSYNATTFHNRDGKLQGVFAAARDVSERKRFEQRLQETNVELERANQAKDVFLASMSHELRTPLNAIIGFTGTLLMKLPGPLNADQEKQLRTVQVSAKLLLLLINDLLDLAKIESGKVELEFEPVTCQSVIEEVRTTLGPMADAKGLHIDLQLPPEELVVRTDRRALSQIITNLTSNAVKFTDEGSVGITLSQQGGNGSPRTVIRVRDSGRGIKPEDQARLFEAFAQMDSMTKRRNEGTGLGLHLSQKLAGLLGGHISFESQFGVGSTFTLTLTQPAA